MLDTSTITITPEYAAHFLEVYVKKTELLPFQRERAIPFTPITVWSLNRICMYWGVTFAGPSLELVAFQLPKPKRSVESPGLKRTNALGRPGRPESRVQLKQTRKRPAE